MQDTVLQMSMGLKSPLPSGADFFFRAFHLGFGVQILNMVFQCLSPLQTRAELSVQTPGWDLQLLEPLRKGNLHPWLSIGSAGVKLTLPLVQVAQI